MIAKRVTTLGQPYRKYLFGSCCGLKFFQNNGCLPVSSNFDSYKYGGEGYCKTVLNTVLASYEYNWRVPGFPDSSEKDWHG